MVGTHSFHDMVSAANQQKSKKIVWTQQADSDFVTLKSLVNQCPKLYFINPELLIILYTNASDYAHGAYLSVRCKHNQMAHILNNLSDSSILRYA